LILIFASAAGFVNRFVILTQLPLIKDRSALIK
jgi:hypothetical protein